MVISVGYFTEDNKMYHMGEKVRNFTENRRRKHEKNKHVIFAF